jgi:hypothetical protein
MKPHRISALLSILVVLLAIPASAAIAYVSASHTVCLQTTVSAGVACTLTGATTAGNVVVVAISLKTPTRALTNLAGSSASAFFMQVTPVTPNGSSNGIVLNVCFNCAALTTVTPTLSGTSIYALAVEEYSGVAALGAWANASGSSTAPSVSITTTDSNNWVVSATSNLGSTGIPTVGVGCGTTTGNLRDANRTGTTSSFNSIGVCDNTVAGAGSLTLTDTITSGLWAAVAIEFRSASAAVACASPCPGLAQYAQWGSNDGGSPTGSSYTYNLPQPTRSGNTLIAMVTAGGGTTASYNNISALSINGNAFTSAVTCNDGGTAPAKQLSIFYLNNVSAGWQNVALTLATATNADDVQLLIGEFYNIATSSPIDGTPHCAAAVSGNFPQAGSITTGSNGDLVFMAGANDSFFSAANYVTSYDPALALNKGSSSLTLLGDTRRFGPFAFFINQGTAGAINPAMYIDQATHDSWNVADVAFKSASAGQAPTGMYIARMITEIPSSTTYRVDLPCSGNLQVAIGSTQPSQAKITGISDASGNTLTWLGSSTTQPQILYKGNSACTNANYRQATITMSGVGVVDPIKFYDVVGSNASPLDAFVSTSTSGASASAGLVNSGSQSQTRYSVTSVSCPNTTASNTQMNFTPSSSGGIAFVVENNGQGPECGASGTNNVFDGAWFGGEDDACCGTLDSSSGYGHLAYANGGQEIWTFNWANCLADTPTTGCASGTGPANTPGSSYSMSIAAFKAPNRASLTLIGVGGS